MEQFLYERPREKLRSKGVGALVLTELIQLIVGSGSRRVSVARISKQVARLLEKSEAPRYQDFTAITGLGNAKASQLVAAIELGRRVHSRRQPAPLPNFTNIRAASKLLLEFSTIDGDLQPIATNHIDITEPSLAVRKMFAHALRDNAASLVVGIGHRTLALDNLNDTHLKILKSIFDTASLLAVEVKEVWLVNKISHQPFRRRSLQ